MLFRSELEHDRWNRLKLDQGWCHGDPRDNEAKLHPDLLPWGEMTKDELIAKYGPKGEGVGSRVLSEEEKEKDRDMVRRIAAILGTTGYTIMKVAAPTEPAK